MASPEQRVGGASEQAADAVLMVRPVRFCANPETVWSNEFQSADADGELSTIQREFDGLVAALREAGIEVVVVDDTVDPATPDAIFPNNWLSTHADGTVITYPMLAPSRRAERRDDIVAEVLGRHGRKVARHIDLSHLEAQERFLEGTGSLVLDRINRLAYACESPRTTREAVEEFARQAGYDIHLFRAYGAGGLPVYHTNVLMCLGSRFALICDEAVDERDRPELLERLAFGRDLVLISMTQMLRFAGNMLELRNADGERFVVMSSQARASLDASQLSALESAAHIVHAPIPTIEGASGGSVRCMMAEIFLPQRES